MGRKASKITVGYKYYMGLFMGLFRGPVNEIVEIRVGDRTAWKGSITDTTNTSINAPDLFGGTKAEGGIDGSLEVYMGKSNQTISQKLKNMLGGKQPAFRGVVTMYFDGMVSAMSPYPKPWKVKARRTTAGWTGGVWYPEKCKLVLQGYDGQGDQHEIHAMNPAHILYECQTNVEWGRGLSRTLIDDVSFRRCADTLYTEGLGLCLRWTRQDTLMSFMQTILDHVGGAMYVSKVTGKLTLKLLRDDYVADNLPIFDMDSGLLEIREATNASPAGMINEVIVTYHNPIIDEEQQVRCHNLAQIQNQGCLNSTTVEYIGVPTGKLAMQLAQRDLRVASTNVRRFSLTFDRRAWNIQPGDVIKIRDPKQRGITEVIVRVGAVEDGTLPDGKISITAIQDQFSFQLNTFNQVQPPDGYKPDLTPAIARRVVYEMPYVDLVQQLPEGELRALSPNDTFLNSQAEKPTPMSAAYDMAIMADGEAVWDIRGNGDFGAFGVLAADVGYFDTVFHLSEMTELWQEVEVGYIARIAKAIQPGLTTPMQITEEFVRIDAVNGNLVTVTRGVMDTIPFRHQRGEMLWVTTLDGGTDWRKYGGAETVDVKILPWTLGGGRFKLEDAPVDHLALNFRQIRPYPPGKVLRDLASETNPQPWFTPADLTYTANAGETPDIYTLTWAHRDRILQSDQPFGHNEGSIGPEPGTSYTIRVYMPDGTIVREETGISGTTWYWPYATAANDVKVEESAFQVVLATLRLWSVRDGKESWEYYEMKVTVHKKPPQYVYDASLMHQAVQRYDQRDDPNNPNPAMDGAYVGAMVRTAVLTDPENFGPAQDLSGANIAALPYQVTQETALFTPVDTLLYETPYIMLSRAGQPKDKSTVSAYVARSSDRVVDSYNLFTKTEDEEDWADHGIQPWTPWGMTVVGLGYFTDEVTLSPTSDKDGVPIEPISVGDILLVDQELIVVQEVDGYRFKIGRGVADTIPAQHYSRRPVWVVSRGYGYSPRAFQPKGKAMVIVRPNNHGMQVPLNRIYPLQLEMQYRPTRPYPPGLMMIGGQPWFNTASGLADDFNPYDNVSAKDVPITWAHRNRVSQDKVARDHFAVGITLEEGVRYRIRVGYNYNVPFQPTQYVNVYENYTADAGFILRKYSLEQWGLQAGRAQQSGGWARLVVTVHAIKDGQLNWQGYTMTLNVPSYPLPPGQKPGGNNGGGNNSGGGTNPPVEPPDRPDPGNPGEGGGTTPGGGGSEGGGTKPDEPKPPVDPVDPENPDTDPPTPPDPEPEPGPVPGWSISWDHGWALTLPDQRYNPNDKDEQ